MMSTLSQQVREAREFADQTTRTIRTVCESAPDCIVDESTKGNVWRATIAPPDNKPAPLTVNGVQVLKLLVNYECTSPPPATRTCSSRHHGSFSFRRMRMSLLCEWNTCGIRDRAFPVFTCTCMHTGTLGHPLCAATASAVVGKKFINEEARSESHSFPTSISRSVGRACDRPSKTSLRCLYTILALTTPMTHSKYLKSSASAGASRKCRRLQNQCRTS